MVDFVGQHPPKLEKDDHWNVCIPDELPYTVASLPFRYSGVRLTFYTYYISPIEIGLVWAKITYLKSHSKAFDFCLQTDVK